MLRSMPLPQAVKNDTAGEGAEKTSVLLVATQKQEGLLVSPVIRVASSTLAVKDYLSTTLVLDQ